MVQHKVLHGVGKLIYGRGSVHQTAERLRPRRGTNEGYAVFVIDHYFRDHALLERLGIEDRDLVFFEDFDVHEPTTEQVDRLRDAVLAERGWPAAVVGVGGGSAMDTAKALSLMLTNPGSSTQYQGLNLIQTPGVFHLGVPTIAGTGAECSTTAVLTGPLKKLGLKCEWTVFDELILDPELCATVPRNQWFYTGMDTYIHCIESETGIHNNAFSKAYGEESLKLCREVFLGPEAGQSADNDDKLVVASLFGGLSLTYSEVGVCHALSYGLSKVLGYRHGYANCIAFNHLEDYYGPAVGEFRRMVERFDIDLPQGLSKGWSDAEIDAMVEVSWNLPHMWIHALGHDWQDRIDRGVLKSLFQRL
ncbi:iron-containing alcohol dehydrogenase [bacterium]|nr:iron-containing alcohol dehydrogenase [bacterium]